MSCLTKLVADIIQLLCRERTRANARAICLYDAYDRIDTLRCNASAYGNAAGHRVRSRHVRICAIVDIEHSCLCSLEKNLPTFIDLTVDECDSIANIWTQTVSIAFILSKDSFVVKRLVVVDFLQLMILDLYVFLQAACELLLIDKVAYPDTDAVRLIHIAWTDAALRRADLVLATFLIAYTIHDTMVWHDDMCAIRDADS